jgi:hypothetical protein
MRAIRSAAFAAAIVLAACTVERRLEEDAAPGSVPPPPEGVVRHPKKLHGYDDPPPPPGWSARPSGLPGAPEWPRITGDFQQAYDKRGKPRLAVYADRTLSEELREWNSVARFVVHGNVKSEGKSLIPTLPTGEVGGAVAGTLQTQNPLTEIRNAPEAILWEFEEGFMEPLLDAGAFLVDRNTMLRLQAADHPTAEKMPNDMPVKKVEVQALLGRADVFMELLITRSPASPYGYEFKAAAKEVKSGRILATVTSLKWPEKTVKTRRWRARSLPAGGDYELIEENILPPLRDLARRLSADMMSALAKMWGKE